MTTTEKVRRSWLDAEIDLSNARIGALSMTRQHVANLIPWLDAIERQAARAFADVLELRQRREETLLDQHEGMLRKEAAGES